MKIYENKFVCRCQETSRSAFFSPNALVKGRWASGVSRQSDSSLESSAMATLKVWNWLLQILRVSAKANGNIYIGPIHKSTLAIIPETSQNSCRNPESRSTQAVGHWRMSAFSPPGLWQWQWNQPQKFRKSTMNLAMKLVLCSITTHRIQHIIYNIHNMFDTIFRTFQVNYN